jgi:hypothetical protein
MRHDPADLVDRKAASSWASHVTPKAARTAPYKMTKPGFIGGCFIFFGVAACAAFGPIGADADLKSHCLKAPRKDCAACGVV